MSPQDKKIPVATHRSPRTASTVDFPAPPPRAAMVNASSNSEAHETSPTTTDTSASSKDKEKEKDMTTTTTSLSRSSTKDRQRETASPAALLAQVRHQEDTIAKLRAEMSIMEGEFQRELDKLSANESETATFWQAKHSALHQQFLRSDTELRLLRAEVDVRNAERDELRHGWEALRRDAKEREVEVRDLKAQVRGLKEFVSTSTRTGGQASDEVFGDGMARLGNGLQNWVITHFRKAKLVDLDNADEGVVNELARLVPMYEELAGVARVHMLQSAVSTILVEMIFDTYFAGLDKEQTSLFRQMESLLSGISGDEPVNQWRANTLAMLRRDSSQLPTDMLTERVVGKITHLLTTLTDAPEASPPRDAALRVLVSSAVDLSRMLVAQKAVLKVYMPLIVPHQRTLFEGDVMEDIGGEEEDGLESREIWCCVFPGVVKQGDENGGQMQFRNVISKARVLCSPED